MAKAQANLPANDLGAQPEAISPLSKELVVGVVGYVGAGCSTTAKRLHLILNQSGYQVHRIKLSKLIAEHFPGTQLPAVEEGPDEGAQRFSRAGVLQDLGDELRSGDRGFALASLAVRAIRDLRGTSIPGEEKIAFIIESIKHPGEVDLLRTVYDKSFRLIAVHCDRATREKRLIGGAISDAKYAGVDEKSVKAFMDRDEKDVREPDGQQVRDAFYLADYFLDNNAVANDGANLTADLQRFGQLLLATGLVRPTLGERAMYHAHAAGLQSSCLSRQVGAALVSREGELVATGTNDVPRFGGGIYSEGRKPDSRCHAWQWTDGTVQFVGCHNDRRKEGLRLKIAEWMSEAFADDLALLAHPVPAGIDTAARAREIAADKIRQHLAGQSQKYLSLPGIKELIEFSRAIHAEMDALLSAARGSISPVGATLYCTTYPCHSCARHLVSAGVARVYYIEPYVKSLATDLHSDAITADGTIIGQGSQQKMAIVPFTGVGPRMYEDFFSKRVELKGAGGAYTRPSANLPGYAVRLRELAKVEEQAASMI